MVVVVVVVVTVTVSGVVGVAVVGVWPIFSSFEDASGSKQIRFADPESEKKAKLAPKRNMLKYAAVALMK